MNYKKIIFISILLLVLSVSAVSAADNNNNYLPESPDLDDSLEIHNSEKLSDGVLNDGVLSDGLLNDGVLTDNVLTDGVGTFDDLQLEINNAAEGSDLNLTRDYNGAYGSRIQLNKDLTIDGQGHTLDCLGEGGCSAFYSSSGNIILKNLRIINGNNDYTRCGGAISIEGSAQYTLINCIFENNHAEGAGGAVCNRVNKTLTITNCTFISNTVADGSGSAVSSRGEVLVKNSLFDSNSNKGLSGTVSTHGGTFEDCIFKNNDAVSTGGGIDCYGDLYLIRCIFENNKVDGEIIHDSYGAAVECTHDIYVDNCTFKDNWADDFGGAISGSNVYINYNQDSNQDYNTFFINNVADDRQAGAIHVFESLYVKNTVFSSNKAKVDGGAIYAFNDVNAVHCLFDSNSVDGASSQCCGGSIYARGDVNVDNCTFKDCFAHDYGGAIYANNVYINKNQAYPQDSNTLFINNSVEGDKGGAIYAQSNVNAINAVFSSNKAHVSGGAISSEGHTTVDACLFDSNRADDHGGALDAENAIINNCTFMNNWAGENGGAIYANGGLTITVIPSIFVNNIAYNGKGGAVYTGKFDKNVKYASFISNRAGDGASHGDDGGAIYISDENTISFESCCFAYNHCSDEGGAIYLDDSDSKLSLINNIFIGNGADDEGTAVFNCGKYLTIKNNWWGDDLVLFDNVLVEWHGGATSNENHYDEDPLKASLTVGATDMSVNYTIPVHISFVSALDDSIRPTLAGLENIIFVSDHLGEFSNYNYGADGIDAWYTPKELGTHKISVKNVFEPAKEIVAYLNVDTSSGRQGDTQVITNKDLSFSHLQKIINDAVEGSVIYLKNNFLYYGGDNVLNQKEGIIINKNLVIDGQGHSLDARLMSGILQASAGHITLRNIIFKNGYQEHADDGGAIRSLGKTEFTIINCTFDSNKALQDGGAIYNEGGDLDVRDSTFVNNRAEGANKLNDCDGGAIHSKSYTYIRNCVFKNNYAADNGGAIYVTGNLQISDLSPSYFESNTAYKGKGGAIYTNLFTTAVKYATFISNRAGDGAIISDDGGAIYINDENDITFESCLFANNHCSDEGGAIYLDSHDSKLSLINNIFIGNAADDEGQTVYNKGNYITVNNNFWGGNNPTKDNDQLIGWMALFVPNYHEVDNDPLSMNLVLDQINCPVNTTFEGIIRFYKSNGALFTGELTGLKHAAWTASPNIDSIRKSYDKNTLYARFTPDKDGKYTINANLLGYSLSKSIDVFNIDIIADEVTTFTNVPVAFKVHLDGDKKYTANQKVRVSFFKDYDLVTDENGDAIVVFDNLNLDTGRYIVDISSNTFKAQSAVNIITTIFAEDIIQIRGDNVEFNAQFINNTGDFLEKSTQVQFFLDGTPYYAVIKDNEGNAVVNFHSLSRGEHKLVVVNPANGESKTYRIVILMGFAGIYNGSNNQTPESQNDTSVGDHLNNNSLNSRSVNGNSSSTGSNDNLDGSSVNGNSSSTGSNDNLDSGSVNGNSSSTGSNGNAVRDNSLFFNHSSFNLDNNRISNDNSSNHSAISPMSKTIANPQTNGGFNNLWWIILLIFAVIVAGGIIKEYKS